MIDLTTHVTLISDMHAASNWGLIHPDFICTDQRTGQKIKYIMNSTQQFSWEHWKKCVKATKNTDAYIFDGDLVDGINQYNYGAVVSSDVSTQVDICGALIGELSPDVPMYFMRGTGYHCGREIIAEKMVSEAVGGKYSDEAIIEKCGIRIFANHHISHAKNKAGALEAKINSVASEESYYGKVDVIVRAHNHTFSAVYTRDHLAIMTPGWQHKTPYAVEKDLVKSPDIGWVTLNIESPDYITVDKRGVVASPFMCKVLRRND